jgi:hypothetical protein
MPSAIQQKSVQRKLLYFGIIAVLFTLAMFVRLARPVQLGPSAQVAGLEQQAKDLALREQDLGQVELTSSAVRLTLTGSRGLVVCALWLAWMEKQKKHEWNELELLVASMTKLQPHFITPWVFQGWNLAYNVAAESDRVKDKYYYLAQGVKLLAEGDRRNKDNPDIRSQLGVFFQSRIGYADETNTLRSLIQLSCIDPLERDPARLRRTDNPREVDLEKFALFCRNHPHLVRRLRETPGKSLDEVLCKTPEDVVDFLEANQRLPSRFEDVPDSERSRLTATPLRAPGDRFPILPPVRLKAPFDDMPTNDSVLGDEFDNFATSGPWFAYAQDPYPRRRPRAPATIIFLAFPGLAQVFRAERLEKEGWFDEGWEITGWFAQPLVAGEGRAAEEWDRAYRRYDTFARQQGLLKTPAELSQLSEAERTNYNYARNLPNLQHFLTRSDVERDPDVVRARKYFYKAEQFRKHADLGRALAMYEDPAAFGPPSSWGRSPATGWRKVLLDHPEYRRDLTTQENCYDFQTDYLSLVRDRRGDAPRNLLLLQDYLAQAASRPCAGAWLPPVLLVPRFPLQIQGPLDEVTSTGEPLMDRKLLVQYGRIRPRTGK